MVEKTKRDFDESLSTGCNLLANGLKETVAIELPCSDLSDQIWAQSGSH